MYKFKKINKTKMYQLVKEFAGIRDLPPIRQCQFGYYSRSNTCYLCVKEGLGSFKVVYDHWGDDVYLLVSRRRHICRILMLFIRNVKTRLSI